jgi:O-antigen ligase
MIEKSQPSFPDKEITTKSIGSLSMLFVVISLVLGVAISLAVGMFGWITLLVIPAAILIVAATWNPNLGLVALVILIFIQLQRVVTEFHDLPGPGQPLVAFLILIISIRILVLNEKPGAWFKNSFILGIYLIFLIISAVTAGVLAPALQELYDVVQNLVIASIILFIIQRPVSLKSAIWAIIIAGMIMASISVFQRLTGTFNNNYWGFGGWEYSGYVGRPRMTGPYATPNPYAQVLVLIFIIALDRMWNERKLILRVFAGTAAAITALAMIYTDSRGGFADLVFTLLIFFVFNRPSLLSLLITFVIGIGLFQLLPSNYTNRISTLTELNPFAQTDTGIKDESFRGRTSENLAAWRMFLDHPIFGVGLNNYAEHYQEYSREIGLDNRREARDPASLYLQLLADQGLIGTFVFLTLVYFVFVNLLKGHSNFKALRMNDEMKITAALFAALAGYMFMSLYRNNAYTNVFWVLIAVCMSATQVAANTIQNDLGYETPVELTH